jgi:hypothetical protein
MATDRTVVFPARFRNVAEEVDAIEALFHRVWAATGKDKNEAICDVFLEGLRTYSQKLTKEGKLTSAQVNIYEQLTRLRDERVQRDQLAKLYEELPLDEFATFCSDNQIDYAGFLEDMRFTITKRVGKNAMTDWLDALLRDGKDHPIEEIRERSETEKVVVNDADWKQMKVIAATRNYSSMTHRGVWKIPHNEE